MPTHSEKPSRLWFGVIGAMVVAGCGLFSERVDFDDPRVVELIEAAGAFDRAAHGFTPIPTEGTLRLESRDGGAYDRMLHFHGRTSRTIAFVKTTTGFDWVHEQEIFTGPNDYESPDGVFKESICLTYETKNISIPQSNELSINYFGDDPRFARKSHLTLTEVAPVLKEWGYPVRHQ